MGQLRSPGENSTRPKLNNKAISINQHAQKQIYKRPHYSYSPTKTNMTYMYDSDNSEKE